MQSRENKNTLDSLSKDVRFTLSSLHGPSGGSLPAGPWFSYMCFKGSISLPTQKRGFQKRKCWVRGHLHEPDSRRYTRPPQEAAPWEGETALMQPLAVCKDSLLRTASHTFLDSLANSSDVSWPRHFWNCVFLQWEDGVASAQILELDLGLNPVCHPPVTSYLPTISEPRCPHPQSGASTASYSWWGPDKLR